jgi:hypothetical protein
MLKNANCHIPTQPKLELEVDLMMGRKPPTHLIFGMQPYFDPTRKQPQTENGRRPQKE